MKRYGCAMVGVVLWALAGCGGSGGTVTCKTPQVLCSGACVDITSDASNCGKCGTKCTAGQTCAASACMDPCMTGMTACGGTCTDTMADLNNCGACGTKCPSGQGCAAGKCAMVSMVGGACKQNSDCGEGKTPTCWKKTILNVANNLPVTGGYCTSKCATDDDCGSGTCISFGSSGKFCLLGCQSEMDCRTSGYACFFGNGFGITTGGICWPDGNLDCDPSMGDGTCMTSAMTPVLGGCQRQAVGMGKRGQCSALCTVGTGTCPKDTSGNSYECVIEDARYTYPAGKPSGDKFAGPVCIGLPMGTLNMPSTECKWTDGKHYINVCVDGNECFLKAMSPVGMGFSSAGDNICHQLCYLPGGKPVDGSMGMTAGDCPMNTKCTDVFGNANATVPAMRVGFCL